MILFAAVPLILAFPGRAGAAATVTQDGLAPTGIAPDTPVTATLRAHLSASVTIPLFTLLKAGYPVDGLYGRDLGDLFEPVQDFKTDMRTDIENQGQHDRRQHRQQRHRPGRRRPPPWRSSLPGWQPAL
ncbi:hypothetical protein ACIGXM_22255 [Kitasatospora sp. NPDC052896]|uniref:hypothetical protein n=1 Tax=Kitasatospora sp. NPDC052896 TaxID=3364061 RepID=UPI0037C97031